MQSEFSVAKLFVKCESGSKMTQVSTLLGDESGIRGNVACHRFRQILILNTKTVDQFSLSPGDLCENVLVRSDGLHDFPSGTELLLGTLRVRLTFHCEPCKKIASAVDPRRITHQRGYLGTILNAGDVSVGDSVKHLGKPFDEIPYTAIERVRWFLDRHHGEVAARDLVSAIALRNSYCRVIPRYLKKLGRKYERRVVFAKKTNQRKMQS